MGGGGRSLGLSPGGGTGPFTAPALAPPAAGAGALAAPPVVFSSGSVSTGLVSASSNLEELARALAVALCKVDREGLRRNPPRDLRGTTYKIEKLKREN